MSAKLWLSVHRSNTTTGFVEVGETPLSIGSDSGNVLVLDHPDVAPFHCRIVFDGQAHRVVNCNAIFGTVLNDHLVTEAPLTLDDRLTLGPFELVLSRQRPRSRPVPPGVGEARDDLMALLRVTGLMTGEKDLQVLLRHMLDCLIRIFKAERCSILLRGRGGQFNPVVTQNLDAATAEKAISGTVVRQVLKTGQPVCHRDLSSVKDLQGAKSLDSGNIRAVVCYPLVRESEIQALFYLDNTATNPLFARGEFQLLELFGTHALGALQNLHEEGRLRLRAGQLQQMAHDAIRQVHDFHRIVARDPKTLQIMRQVEKVAASDVTTLLLGPSGSGKELFARAIHHASTRKDGPFIAVNCGALPRELVESELFGHEKGAFSGAAGEKLGKFELSQGGTLFLDEIGELPTDVQVKLLRALQERVVERVGGTRGRAVDFRLLAATNADLKEKVQQGTFRQDLLFRINVFEIHLPSLKERREDIGPLAEHFVAEFNLKFRRKLRGLSEEALAAMLAYDWPGNIRELRNVIERAFVIEESDLIRPGSLPFGPATPDLSPSPEETPFVLVPLSEAVGNFERSYLTRALEQFQYNVTSLARALKVSRQTLYSRVNDLGISLPER